MAKHGGVWSRIFSSPSPQSLDQDDGTAGEDINSTESSMVSESLLKSNESTLKANESTLKSIKATVDNILLLLKHQTAKRDEDNARMSEMAKKIDVQGEKLVDLEQLLNNTNTSTAGNVSFREEIAEATKENTSEVTFLVRKEVTRICDVCSQLTDDVTAKFDKVEDKLSKPLADVRADLKHIDQRITDLETSLNKLEVTSKQVNSNLLTSSDLDTLLKKLQLTSHPSSPPPKQITPDSIHEIRATLQSFSNTHLVNQTVLKDDLKKKLGTLMEIADKQSSVVASLQNEMVVQGNMRRMLIDMNKSIVDQVVTESHITREVIQKTRKARTSYKCDFHIVNFSKWAGSGEECFSKLWYIDQSQTHVKADVIFNGDMTMSVGLAHGRYPKVVGLDAYPGTRVKVKVTAVQQSRKGDNWDLGAGEINIDEKQIPPECDGWLSVSGWGLADVSCEELKKRGLVEEDMLLLRYIISVSQ